MTLNNLFSLNVYLLRFISEEDANDFWITPSLAIVYSPWNG